LPGLREDWGGAQYENAAAPPVGERVVVWWRAEDMITLGE